MQKKIESVAAYIAGFPPEVRRVLAKIRAVIRDIAPQATESITYGVPTFKVGGRPLVYFAAFNAHVSLYPMTAPVKTRFKKELDGYKGGKGTIQFPLDAPVPYALIRKLVRFKMQETRKRG